MRILFLAPHPFYQERGTPIAVKLLLTAISDEGHHVDVVTYHEGERIEIPGVRVHRIPALPFLSGIRPGFSLKKLVCDLLMAFTVWRLVRRNRYDVAHGVEESVFLLRVLSAVVGLPYVYDMDSSMPQQMVDKHPWLRVAARPMAFCERIAVRGALAVVPVCEELATSIAKYGPRKVIVLHDVSLLEQQPVRSVELRARFGIKGVLLMYVGNLESYQGIDLLLHGFGAAVQSGAADADLVLIGGAEADIRRYRRLCDELDIGPRVHWLGPRPIDELAGYLHQADVLVSPRTKGSNTPMKIYSYLHSGKAVLATDLVTHTQVLTLDVAMLAKPCVASFSKALRRLIKDEDLRSRLGRGGHRLIETKYSYRAYREKVRALLSWIQGQVGARTGVRPSPELRESTAR
jgi:glycosyltransferase involved in cell wall biosynthesis